jgi:predicted transcriptional regulator
MTSIPPQLNGIRAQLDLGQSPSRVRAREFLRWFGVQRPGHYAVRNIRTALDTLQLTTHPDFESAFPEEQLSIVATDTQRPYPATATAGADQPETSLLSAESLLPEVANDPAHRIGKLEAANRTPISVQPTATVEEAITLMMVNDFSQLPVMPRPTDVKGIVTWVSVGKALYFGRQIHSVSSCMVPHYELQADVSLFAAIPIIVQHDYVLVRNSARRITGIVTTADLSLQFRTLSEPFLLLGEAENHIRGLISRCFTKAEIVAAGAPESTGRAIQSVSDLTFGEYKALLEQPNSWQRLNLRLDRKQFVALLESVRVIRNKVMHFSPNGVGEEDLQILSQFAALMRELAEPQVT